MTLKSRRWLARASFALMLAAVAILLGFAGWHTLALIAFALISTCAVLAGGTGSSPTGAHGGGWHSSW